MWSMVCYTRIFKEYVPGRDYIVNLYLLHVHIGIYTCIHVKHNSNMYIVTLLFSLLDLMARILYRRHVDRRQLLRCGGIKSKTAKTLSQNIAPVPAPPTSELVKAHVSRKHMHQGEI